MRREKQLPGFIALSIIAVHCIGLSVLLEASENLSIRTLLSWPMSYHLRTITLRGTVSEVRPIPVTIIPMDGWTCTLSGKGSLILDDGTASLRIEVPGTCAPKEVPLPEEGDQVKVEVVINAQDVDLSKKVIVAVVNAIQITSRGRSKEGTP